MKMIRLPLLILCMGALLLPTLAAQSTPAPTPTVADALSGGTHSNTWIDTTTGHRVVRLTPEPYSNDLYFTANAFTSDGLMIYGVLHQTGGKFDGGSTLYALNLSTLQSRQLVAQNTNSVVVARKSAMVYFTKPLDTRLYSVNADTGVIAKIGNLPPRADIQSLNADETLLVGTSTDVEPPVHQIDASKLKPTQVRAPWMELRLADQVPMTLFTVNVQTGKVNPILHSTDWLSHPQFSPTDPTLLMYCHEGAWQEVDRIWMIHTDATHNTLIHPRTMLMEIAGHEFWGLDGETIWYDWQYPKGEDFFVASYNLETHKRVAYHLQRNEWSIHFNLTQDLDLFCGDGGDSGQVASAPDGEWIELFRPQMIGGTEGALNDPNFWQPGVFHSEHLVNMAHQNYRAEPNPRFSPDKSYVFFTSNMFGRSYVFAVEVAKAADQTGAVSTPDLATQFNPIMPTPTTTQK